MLKDLLLNPTLWDRCRLVAGDERRLFALVDACCKISVRCREKGLLAANAGGAVDGLPEPIGQAAFRMVEEGWPPEFIEETCCSALLTTPASGADLVAMLVGIKAALMIMRGEETKQVRVALSAIAGGARVLAAQSGEWRLLRS